MIFNTLVGAHFVFSGGLDCSVRAHACSIAASILCSSAPNLHVALMVFCLNACMSGFRAHVIHWFGFFAECTQ
jgi:hypothetical protein